MNKKKSRRKMKSRKKNAPRVTWMIALGGALLLFGSIALIQIENAKDPYVPEVNGAPSLKFDKDKVDLGDVHLGETVRAAFEYTNVGDETLYLDKEKTYVEVVEGC